MKIEHMINIFLVDDDTLFLKLLQLQFMQEGDFNIETFVSGELCLQRIHHQPDIVILDYYLDGIDKSAINGIETLDKIKATQPHIPVIMLSAQDKIDVAIKCMHHKAFDYVVKSETAFLRLKKIISNIFEYKKMTNELNWYMDKM